MQRVPEPESMNSAEQVSDYVRAIRDLQLIAPTHAAMLSRAAAALPLNARVLELGCGSGDTLCGLARLRPDLDLCGIDLADRMLREADSLIRSQKLGSNRVRVAQGDMTNLQSIVDRPVDAVVAFLSLHHLPDHEHLVATIGSIGEVLRPGGAIFLADFARLPSRFWVDRVVAKDRDCQPPTYEADLRNSLHAAWSVGEWSDALGCHRYDGEHRATRGLDLFQTWSTPRCSPESESVYRQRACSRLSARAMRTFRQLDFLFRLSRRVRSVSEVPRRVNVAA